MRTTAVSLEIREASVFYGANRVLDRVSLSAAGGEFIALLGASGCGEAIDLAMIRLAVEQEGPRASVLPAERLCLGRRLKQQGADLGAKHPDPQCPIGP
jgi:ABC-type transporter Mla maintaining outer membrane lipid asymmetry ATPase subunit MlaF